MEYCEYISKGEHAGVYFSYTVTIFNTSVLHSVIWTKSIVDEVWNLIHILEEGSPKWEKKKGKCKAPSPRQNCAWPIWEAVNTILDLEQNEKEDEEISWEWE